MTDEAWKAVEEEAVTRLRSQLTGRQVVEIDGPNGWSCSSVPLGRVETLPDIPGEDGVGRASMRRVQPLVEVRVPFTLRRDVVEAIGRGDEEPELEVVADAARAVARVENRAIFHGWEKAGMSGIASASPHTPVSLSRDYTFYPVAVTRALETLREEGVAGPYALVLGPLCYEGLTRTTGVGGYPVIEHVRRLVDGPVIWTPALQGAVVLSRRGGDFELTLGQDVSLGYLGHDASGIELYLEETFTFRPLGPEAAVGMRYDA
jgi:uncharacterized linocin/CFP29 family protein